MKNKYVGAFMQELYTTLSFLGGGSIQFVEPSKKGPPYGGGGLAAVPKLAGRG